MWRRFKWRRADRPQPDETAERLGYRDQQIREVRALGPCHPASFVACAAAASHTCARCNRPLCDAHGVGEGRRCRRCAHERGFFLFALVFTPLCVAIAAHYLSAWLASDPDASALTLTAQGLMGVVLLARICTYRRRKPRLWHSPRL